MDDKPRLIEVAFPLKQASVASVREKNVRQGHVSTLHIWPARRPLAACRAVLLATLLPDPGDPEGRRELLAKIGGTVVTKPVEEVDEEGETVIEDKQTVEGGLLGWGQVDGGALDQLRKTILAFYDGHAPTVLDPFGGGGAIPLEAMRLGAEVTASDLNPVAWFILRCTLEYPQRFAQKKWPLPNFVRQWPDFVGDFVAGKVRKRKGNKRVHFSDPQQLALGELPDADLAWQVRAWGRWVLDRARADLASHYPVIAREPTVAYLWARTARDKVTTGRIPLLKSFWLCKKKGQRVALLPIPNDNKSCVTFLLLRDSDLDQPARIVTENPHLRLWEVNADNLFGFLKAGTMSRAGVWSPLSGRPGLLSLTMEDLRRQGQQGLLSTQMTAVVVEAMRSGAKKPVKYYRLPNSVEAATSEVQPEEIESVFADVSFGIPNEPLPPVGTLGFRIPLYGFRRWRDVFTSRQLLALGVFVTHTCHAIALARREAPFAAEAIAAYLAILFGRFVNYLSTLCIWDSAAGEVKQTFSRYALPMNWDFAEANPLSESDRYYAGGVEVAARTISALLAATRDNQHEPHIRLGSSVTTSFAQHDVIITDPPYYDAIPYSDLMDFFYIWQKRLLAGLDQQYEKAYNSELGPKWDDAANDGELIQDESRHSGDRAKAKKAYEDGMATSFQKCRESLRDDGRFVVVFANTDVDAWETLVSAIIRAGFLVVASWPIQTEMTGGFRNFNRASLSSSIWIICRKRSMTAQAGWQESVFEETTKILFNPRDTLSGRNILQYYFDLGISGPDFIWAALGPALEAFSKHPYVKKTAGGVLSVSDFLKDVRRLVLQFCLGELPGFSDFQQETRGRGESLEMDPITQYYLLHRTYFGFQATPAGACILYANACGKNVTELKVVWNVLEKGDQKKHRHRPEAEDEFTDGGEEGTAGKGNEYRLVDWKERTSNDELGEAKANQPGPLIDKLHRLMYLFQRNRTVEVQQLSDKWGLSSERAFKPLLQAVRELAVRDHNDDERRLVEALATQLRMNRKTVMVANEMKEVSLFDVVEDETAVHTN